MKTESAEEAIELGRAATEAIERAGGMGLVRGAEVDPDSRTAVADILAPLGVWELAPRRDQLELEAAASVCRAAGRFATPYPIAERLARPENGSAQGLLMVAGPDGPAAHGDLPLRWAVVRPDGTAATFTDAAAPACSTLGYFTTRVRSTPTDSADIEGAALVLILQSWVLLGLLDSVLDKTSEHVRVREQFGQRLADMQGIQFALTDAVVAVATVADLAAYTTWRFAEPEKHRMFGDALALRAVALESAETVLRIGHQLHGAAGFCYEADLSWLSRHSHPLRRLPFGRTETEAQLVAAIEKDGFSGLFERIGNDS